MGTEKFPFNRLSEWIAEAIREKIIKEEVIMQLGNTPVQPGWPKLMIPHQWLKHEELDEYMRKCTRLVTHAGVGYFLQARNNGQIPIFVPRKQELGEHYDNHQMALVEQLHQDFGLPIVNTYEEFIKLIRDGTNNIKLKTYRPELIAFLEEAVQQ